MGVAWSSRECVHGHMCKYARDHAGARSTYTQLDTRHDKSHTLCVYHLLQTSLPHLRLDCNRPCGRFFIGTWDNDGVCQWTNCHSKTWQELLQKITNIIPRQDEWRSLFSSATPHPLLPISFIIRYEILEWGLSVPLILLSHMWLISGWDDVI